MKNFLVTSLVGAMLAAALPAQAGTMPFPRLKNDKSNKYSLSIPGRSGSEMNAAIKAYYLQWKSDYLKSAKLSNQAQTPVLYVKGYATGHPPANWGNTKIVSASEHTSYGMLLAVLMDGQGGNNSEKDEFNKLLDLFLGLKSTACTSSDGNDPNPECSLMSWAVPEPSNGIIDITKRDGSATDGDTDIMYALLLADAQWGSSGSDTGVGARHYKNIAKKLLQDIARHNITPARGYRIGGGDYTRVWYDGDSMDKEVDGSNRIDYDGDKCPASPDANNCPAGTSPKTIKGIEAGITRSSDWQLYAYKAAAAVFGSTAFIDPKDGSGNLISAQTLHTNVRTEMFRIYDNYFKTASQKYGLLPDFMRPTFTDDVASKTKVKAVHDHFLFEEYPDGTNMQTSRFSENAVRLPWRMTWAAMKSGDANEILWARGHANLLEKETFHSHPIGDYFDLSDISNTYALDGTPKGTTGKGQSDSATSSDWKAQHYTAMLCSASVFHPISGLSSRCFEFLKDKHVGPGNDANGFTKDGYFKDSLTLISLLTMSHNYWWR